MAAAGRRPRLALLAALIAAQACDGVLTYQGIAAFGLEIERNPLVAWYVARLGAGTALLAIKSVGCLCALLLYWRSMTRVMAALTILYVVGAVAPWLSLWW